MDASEHARTLPDGYTAVSTRSRFPDTPAHRTAALHLRWAELGGRARQAVKAVWSYFPVAGDKWALKGDQSTGQLYIAAVLSHFAHIEFASLVSRDDLLSDALPATQGGLDERLLAMKAAAHAFLRACRAVTGFYGWDALLRAPGVVFPSQRAARAVAGAIQQPNMLLRGVARARPSPKKHHVYCPAADLSRLPWSWPRPPEIDEELLRALWERSHNLAERSRPWEHLRAETVRGCWVMLYEPLDGPPRVVFFAEETFDGTTHTDQRAAEQAEADPTPPTADPPPVESQHGQAPPAVPPSATPTPRGGMADDGLQADGGQAVDADRRSRADLLRAALKKKGKLLTLFNLVFGRLGEDVPFADVAKVVCGSYPLDPERQPTFDDRVESYLKRWKNLEGDPSFVSAGFSLRRTPVKNLRLADELYPDAPPGQG
jgi:hypothetical protein